MSGYVDMAFVFMVVGLQGHWKAQIAYFLTQSLSPETQEVLLVHALEELHERGITLVCVTSDGHASNRHLYICTYRFSQDHSQLLFNSIRAPGGWSNNPSAGQFHFLSSHGAVWGVFKFIRKCGNTGASVFLSAQEMSSSQTAEETEELPSSFADISAIVRDHSYLPTRFGGLVDNAPVCISGFGRGDQLCSFIRQSVSGQAVKLSYVIRFVRADGAEDVFGLGELIQET
ncbi:hypothetical protein GOODEAATRI_007022 [Goodea atripinnis]|uniref:Uncharacterized protein n=1 Tax=Goodea atripinnis TaxID=208336 RepID=A0ABV0PLJ1_9TELE